MDGPGARDLHPIGAAPPARGTLIAAVLVGAIVAGAAVVRLQDLMLVPRLTDETEEVLVGLRIFHGQALPLVGVDTYIGAMFSYLMAAVFSLLGPRPEAGRLFVLVAGAIGVIPTYLLGRSIGGAGTRGLIVGLLAALLQAGSATDILVTSRLAYSNSLTPGLTMTGLWLLHRAMQSRSGPPLAAGGLAFGLALQTHVAAVVVWPGLAVYLLLHRRAISPWWLVAAAGLALMAISNILLYNVINAGATMNEMLYRSSDYGGAPGAGLSGWPDRLAVLLRVYAQALGGRVSEYIEPSAFFTLPVLIFTGLGLAGLVLLGRRREWLPLLAILSGLLMISLLNARLEPVVARSRHYAQLLPIGFVVVAVTLDALRVWIARRTRAVTASVAVAIVTLSLVLMSWFELQAYLSDRLSRPEKNNREMLQAVDAVVGAGPPGERVYLDGQLASADINSNRRGIKDCQFLLTIRGQEFDTIDLTQRPLPVGRGVTGSRRVILSQESIPVAEARYRLVPLDGSPAHDARFRAFRAFQLEPG